MYERCLRVNTTINLTITIKLGCQRNCPEEPGYRHSESLFSVPCTQQDRKGRGWEGVGAGWAKRPARFPRQPISAANPPQNTRDGRTSSSVLLYNLRTPPRSRDVGASPHVVFLTNAIPHRHPHLSDPRNHHHYCEGERDVTPTLLSKVSGVRGPRHSSCSHLRAKVYNKVVRFT